VSATARDLREALSELLDRPISPAEPLDAAVEALRTLARQLHGLPHSRACGLSCPGHGAACNRSCPTCGGRADWTDDTLTGWSQVVTPAAAPSDVRDQVDASPWLSAAWMQTYTGVAFRPWSAPADDIVLEDIAHSLAFQCRYNGHVGRFYSVAQHAVLLATYALDDESRPADTRLDDAYWCLFHDAAEAYIGDMVRPVKIEMPAFRALDDDLTAKVAERFNLPGTVIPDHVKSLDARILLDERDALLTMPPQEWDVDQLAPLGIGIVPWSPEDAEEAFLMTYARLERLRADLADADENPNAPARGTLARIFYDHDYDRLECGDHAGACCPVAAGDPQHPCHGLAEPQHAHYERMVEAAGYVIGDEADL